MNHSEKRYNLRVLRSAVLLALLSTIYASANSEYATLRGRVKKVFDGDTIEVRLENGKFEHVRFWGIDTPESYLKRFGYSEYMSDEAKHFTQNLLTGKEVILKTFRHGDDFLRDKYQRILAFVYLGNRDISTLLLSHGLAKVYRKSKSPRHGEFVKIEKEAELNRKGIWNKDAEKEYYRKQYISSKNRYLIIWFWEHDRQFLLKLLKETP